MARKSIEERLEANKKKQDRLKAIEKQLLAQQKEKKRKSRTQRLIKRGAELEKILDLEISDKDASNVIAWFTETRHGKDRDFTMAEWLKNYVLEGREKLAASEANATNADNAVNAENAENAETNK